MQMVFVWTRYLNSPSKLKDIEEQLWVLGRKSVALRYHSDVQDNEDVSRLLEKLQELVNDYMVCLW